MNTERGGADLAANCVKIKYTNIGNSFEWKTGLFSCLNFVKIQMGYTNNTFNGKLAYLVTGENRRERYEQYF